VFPGFLLFTRRGQVIIFHYKITSLSAALLRVLRPFHGHSPFAFLIAGTVAGGVLENLQFSLVSFLKLFGYVNCEQRVNRPDRHFGTPAVDIEDARAVIAGLFNLLFASDHPQNFIRASGDGFSFQMHSAEDNLIAHPFASGTQGEVGLREIT
jgi:hypothetical protein